MTNEELAKLFTKNPSVNIDLKQQFADRLIKAAKDVVEARFDKDQTRLSTCVFVLDLRVQTYEHYLENGTVFNLEFNYINKE